MMRLVQAFGACDCHSHVFGPFDRFPLSSRRTFDPPSAPIEALEAVWRSVGVDRAVLIQGSAHGDDHRATLAAIARSPETRRGVAVLDHTVEDARLAELHTLGVRGVRFNWLGHLLGSDPRSHAQRLADASELLHRVVAYGWHAEVHLDIADLDLLSRMSIPSGMPVVIDHMARMNAAASDVASQVRDLTRLLERDTFWVKLSGADRLSRDSASLDAAAAPMTRLLHAAPERCVWGLDWPHVNLERQRTDDELTNLLLGVAGDEATLERVLIKNPELLYDLPATVG